MQLPASPLDVSETPKIPNIRFLLQVGLVLPGLPWGEIFASKAQTSPAAGSGSLDPVETLLSQTGRSNEYFCLCNGKNVWKNNRFHVCSHIITTIIFENIPKKYELNFLSNCQVFKIYKKLSLFLFFAETERQTFAGKKVGVRICSLVWFESRQVFGMVARNHGNSRCFILQADDDSLMFLIGC